MLRACSSLRKLKVICYSSCCCLLNIKRWSDNEHRNAVSVKRLSGILYCWGLLFALGHDDWRRQTFLSNDSINTMSLDFSMDPMLPAAQCPGVDSASNRNEYQESSWGVKGGLRIRLTTLQAFVSRLSKENVGASTSHNPMGLYSLLQGELCWERCFLCGPCRGYIKKTPAGFD
jgi:hypothetical protein